MEKGNVDENKKNMWWKKCINGWMNEWIGEKKDEKQNMCARQKPKIGLQIYIYIYE